MSKMFASAPTCKAATMEGGRRYNVGKDGLLNVENPAHIRDLKAAGFVIAGSVRTASKKYWECECGWTANINSCPKCHRTDLTRVEA